MRIKDFLSLYATTNKIEQLDSEEWTLIQEIVSILKPLEDTTKKLSASDALLSDVTPLVRTLEKVYDGMRNAQTQAAADEETATSGPVNNIISTLKVQLNRRFSEVNSNNLYKIATFLDPRYKEKFFSESVVKEIKQILTPVLEVYSDSPLKTSHDHPSTSKEKEEGATLMNSIFSMLESDEDEPDDPLSKTSPTSLLVEYIKEKRLQPEGNPLRYWNVTDNKFGGLCSMAREYLSAPATSVSSEQFFSAAGIVYDPSI